MSNEAQGCEGRKGTEKHLRPCEIAGFMSVHPKTVVRWLKEGLLRGKEIRGHWYVPESEFNKFIKLGE